MSLNFNQTTLLNSNTKLSSSFYVRTLNTHKIHIINCVASLPKDRDVANNKKMRFLLILIGQVMTNLLKKLAFWHKYLRSYGRFTNYIITYF